jgi:hypothetical protein
MLIQSFLTEYMLRGPNSKRVTERDKGGRGMCHDGMSLGSVGGFDMCSQMSINLTPGYSAKNDHILDAHYPQFADVIDC